LSALLDQALLADSRGDSLAAFAQQMCQAPEGAAELVARPQHIQLLTSHKAKGLEWQTVVLFGLFARPDFPPPEYPCWIPSAASGQPPACLYDKFHAAQVGDGENSPAAIRALERLAAFERLLYVSVTRPKQTLILADASALITDEKLRAGSLAEILRIQENGAAGAWWKNLPVLELHASKRKKLPPPNTAPGKSASSACWPAPEWHPEMFATAQLRAKSFSRRVLPSTLAHHAAMIQPERAEPDLFAPPDYPEEQTPPTSAVDYGNWWHQVMEHTPWAAGQMAWIDHWETQWPTAPDPARARNELQRLRESPLLKKLTTPGLAFAAELPFLWAEENGERAFDGCIDFAVWDAKAARWLVVDWKTDQTKGDAGKELRERYGAQIEVYARALYALTGSPAEALIYGTRSGMLVAL